MRCKDLVKLHEQGICKGCCWSWECPDPLHREIGAFGVFDFILDDGSPVTGPYQLRRQPAQPVHLDQLPPAVRLAVRQLQLPLSFLDLPFVQPIEHTPCLVYSGSAYLDSTRRRIRPIPGEERAYAEDWTFLRTLRADYEVDEPRAGRRKPKGK
jgi:hypothetical protein